MSQGRSRSPVIWLILIVACLDYPVSFFVRRFVPVFGVGPDSVYHRKRSSAGKRALAQAYGLAEVRRLEAQNLAPAAGLPEVPRYP